VLDFKVHHQTFLPLLNWKCGSETAFVTVLVCGA